MTRQIIIGDIHGCVDELHDLLAALSVTADDVVISVGDLVDRGPDSPGVVRFFRDRPNSHVIVGNHERKHIRGIFSYAQEITRLQFGTEYDDAVAWMRSLPYYLELDDAIVVHAALLPGRSLAEQPDEILCGSTSGEKELSSALGDRWWHEVWTGPKPVIFGHHVVAEPLVRPNAIYGLDTGACHGGRLTALTLPDFTLHSVPARADHWARVKRVWQADVLAAKPWATMPLAEIDEQLDRFRTVEELRSRAYIAALRDWRAQVEDRFASTLLALQREAARLDSEGGAEGRANLARAHPLSKLMFQSFGGRLDEAAFRKQVHTPHRLDEIAGHLGLAALVPPAPTPRVE